MASPKDVLEELNYLTGQLTERTRLLASGVAAFCWAGLVTRSSDMVIVLPRNVLLASLVLAMLALVADFFQYIFGYFYNSNLFIEAQKNNSAEIRYNSEALLYRLRLWCFYGKLLVTVVSVLYFGANVVRSLAIDTK